MILPRIIETGAGSAWRSGGGGGGGEKKADSNFHFVCPVLTERIECSLGSMS